MCIRDRFTGKNKDAIKADLTDQAKDRVKLNLILAAIVEAENIEVTDEERNSELETIANIPKSIHYRNRTEFLQ